MSLLQTTPYIFTLIYLPVVIFLCWHWITAMIQALSVTTLIKWGNSLPFLKPSEFWKKCKMETCVVCFLTLFITGEIQMFPINPGKLKLFLDQAILVIPSNTRILSLYSLLRAEDLNSSKHSLFFGKQTLVRICIDARSTDKIKVKMERLQAFFRCFLNVGSSQNAYVLPNKVLEIFAMLW